MLPGGDAPLPTCELLEKDLWPNWCLLEGWETALKHGEGAEKGARLWDGTIATTTASVTSSSCPLEGAALT